MFKQRKHKTFNYKSRFLDSQTPSDDEEHKHEFVRKWRKESGKKVKQGFSVRLLILVLVLLLVCMYLLEKKYM